MLWDHLSCHPPLVAVLIAHKPCFRGLEGWGRRGFAAIKHDTGVGVGTLGREEGQSQGHRTNSQDRYPLHCLALGPDHCGDKENSGAKPTEVAP